MTTVKRVVALVKRMQRGEWSLKAAILAVAMSAASMAGATGSYTNSASGYWDADGSWTGSKPAAGGAADTAIIFNPAGADNSTNNLTGDFVLNRMDVVSGNVTLSGNALVFNNNGATGPLVTNTSGAVAVINNNITVGNDTTFGAVNDITLNGLVSGTGGLIKTGVGTLTITTNSASGATYMGTTLIASGTLWLNYPSTVTVAIGTTNITIQNGATLKSSGNNSTSQSLNHPNFLYVQAGGTFQNTSPTWTVDFFKADTGATITGNPGAFTLKGTDTSALDAAVFGSVFFPKIICGATSGSQTFQFDGTGTGAVIGRTTSESLSWRNSAAPLIMDIADSSSSALDTTLGWLNIQPAAGGGKFIKQGAGVLQINNMDFGGSFPTKPVSCIVSNGTLVLNTSATNALGCNFASLSVNSGATLQVGTNGLEGAIYTNVTNNGTVIFSRSDSCSYANILSGSGDVVHAGSGTLTLSGTNSIYGRYTVSNGTLVVSSTGSLGNNSTNIIVDSGTLILSNSVSIANNAAVRIANGGGAKVNLAAGVNESVDSLYFGDKQRSSGTYGAAGSGANVIDGEHFSGSGILTVLHGSKGGTLIRVL